MIKSNKLSPEQLSIVRSVAAQMAVFGGIDDELLVSIAEDFFAGPEPAIIQRVIDKARAGGVSETELFYEYYGPPSPRRRFSH